MKLHPTAIPSAGERSSPWSLVSASASVPRPAARPATASPASARRNPLMGETQPQRAAAVHRGSRPAAAVPFAHMPLLITRDFDKKSSVPPREDGAPNRGLEARLA